jgi:lambda repressor-like predicted transcriptional regulator
MNNTLIIPLNHKQRRTWIKYQLELRGFRLSAIARQLGVKRQNINLALNKSYPHIERTIADTLDLTPEIL